VYNTFCLQCILSGVSDVVMLFYAFDF